MAGCSVIRPMEEKDLARIHEIERCSFAVPWSEDAMRSELGNPVARYLVLEEEGQVMGYVGTWIIIDEGHITNIAVHPDARGRGHGKALLLGLMRIAQELGVAFMDLEVRVSNAPAISLYRKLGFKPAGIRKGYYEDNGEDAQIMVNDKLWAAIQKNA